MNRIGKSMLSFALVMILLASVIPAKAISAEVEKADLDPIVIESEVKPEHQEQETNEENQSVEEGDEQPPKETDNSNDNVKQLDAAEPSSAENVGTSDKAEPSSAEDVGTSDKTESQPASAALEDDKEITPCLSEDQLVSEEKDCDEITKQLVEETIQSTQLTEDQQLTEENSTSDVKDNSAEAVRSPHEEMKSDEIKQPVDDAATVKQAKLKTPTTTRLEKGESGSSHVHHMQSLGSTSSQGCVTKGVTCLNEDGNCPLPNGRDMLTLVAPERKVEGGIGSIDAVAYMDTDLLGELTVEYFQKDGTKLSSPPETAGEYYVRATLNTEYMFWDPYTRRDRSEKLSTVVSYTIYPSMGELTATYGDKLSDVPLPDQWFWDEPDASVGEVGQHSFDARYMESSDRIGSYVKERSKLTVTVLPAELKVTAEDHSIFYGETPENTGVSYEGFVNGEDKSVLSGELEYTYGYQQGDNAGEYSIIPSGLSSNNYNIIYKEGKLTVDPVELTIAAKDKEIIYGDAPENAGVSYEGFVNGEDESVLSGELEYTYGYQQGDNAGEYSIIPSGLSSNNYNIIYKEGKLTVDPVELTIAAKDKEITYGDAPENAGVSYEGFVNGEDESVLSGELEYSYDYRQGDDAGEYTITPSGLTSGNYEITFVDGKLTVNTLGDAAITVITEGDDIWLDIELNQESAEKLLTEDELKDYNNGVPVTVYILVNELKENEVPAADKKLAENFLKDGKIGQYLDLTLWVKAGNRDARQITNAASDITLKIAIPEKLQTNASDVEHTFYLIRVHDGKAMSLTSTTGDTLEAKSSLFSTYAIGYKDTEVTDDTKTGDTKKDTIKTSTAKKSSGKSNPETGDVTMLGTWFTLAGASAAGLGALALSGKRRKNNRSDNRKAGHTPE